MKRSFTFHETRIINKPDAPAITLWLRRETARLLTQDDAPVDADQVHVEVRQEVVPKDDLT